MNTRIWTEQMAALIYQIQLFVSNVAKHDIQFQIGDLGQQSPTHWNLN